MKYAIDQGAEGEQLIMSANEPIMATKQANQSPAMNERQFRSAFETAAHGMALVSLSGHWIKVNRALCEIVGYSEQELLATDFQTLTHPDDLATDLSYVQSLLAGKIYSYHLEKRYIHKHGHAVRIMMSVSLVRDEEENPVHFVSQIQDVSRQKAAEMRLALQYEITKIMDAATGFNDAVYQILRTFGVTLGWQYGEYWVYSPKQDRLEWQMCWHEGKWESFANASRELSVHKGQGLPGMVLDGEQPVWLGDLQTAAAFIGRPEATGIGLRAAFSFPILAEGKIVGVISFFSPQIQPEDETVISLLQAIGMQIGSYYQRMKQNEQLKLWSEIIKNSSEGILITNSAGEIVAVNNAFCRMTGYETSDILSKTPNMFKSGRHDKAFYRDIWLSLHNVGVWQGEIWDKRKDGIVFPKWSIISKIRGLTGEVTHYFAIYRDLSAEKKADERIYHLTNFDLLTGTPNRNMLIEHLTAVLEHARQDNRQAAVLCLNLDRFKQINDSIGHAVGDAVLKEMSTRLKGCLGKADAVSRLGADEFIIVIEPVNDIGSVKAIVDRILSYISQPLWINKYELRLTASVGISVFPNDGEAPAILVQNATNAMREAKKWSQNSYAFFSPTMNAAVSERLSIEMNLSRALEHNEFRLHYQPQVDVRDNRLVGFEALVRWHKPGEGLLPPGIFLSIAEETGLIIPLGNWIIKEVCRQCKEWEQLGMADFTVAVNISALQFLDPDFIDTLFRIVDDSGVWPARLEAEITEGIVMRKEAAAIRDLTRIKQHGFQLAIDDFGTGYSSLSYLSKFPVDKLKIDASFVKAMATSASDMAIVDSIISLGKNLGLKVIAEGVETAQQLKLLREKGCEEVQGYYYAKPMPGELVPAWIKTAKQTKLIR